MTAASERSVRSVSMAFRVVDDLTGDPIPRAEVISGVLANRIVSKPDGYHVFTDVEDGTYGIGIRSRGFRDYSLTATLPLDPAIYPLVEVPGENELILAVRQVHAGTIVRFAARDIYPGFPAGSAVIGDGFTATLAADLAGEDVEEAELSGVPGGVSISANDFLRVRGERLIRLRPGPYYPFEPLQRRLAGTILHATSGEPIAGAEVRIERVNSKTVTARTLGSTAADVARFHTISSGSNLRVVGTDPDILGVSDSRGRFQFYFTEKNALTIDEVRLHVEAAGYDPLSTGDIDLTTEVETTGQISLIPS